jgi:hypothetical protein
MFLGGAAMAIGGLALVMATRMGRPAPEPVAA